MKIILLFLKKKLGNDILNNNSFTKIINFRNKKAKKINTKIINQALANIS